MPGIYWILRNKLSPEFFDILTFNFEVWYWGFFKMINPGILDSDCRVRGIHRLETGNALNHPKGQILASCSQTNMQCWHWAKSGNRWYVCDELVFFCLHPLPSSWDVILTLFYLEHLRASQMPWKFQQLNDPFTYSWMLLWQLKTLKVTDGSLCRFPVTTLLTWKIFQLLSLPSNSYKDNPQ